LEFQETIYSKLFCGTEMAPSEITFQELSNEWAYQSVATITGFLVISVSLDDGYLQTWVQFLCAALGDRSHHQSLVEAVMPKDKN
jgi:hypothetical protein